MRALVTLLALLTLPAAGCIYHSVLVTDDGRSYPPTNPSVLRVHPGREPGFAYSVIGRVAVLLEGDGPEAMRELALAAASAGADAVLEVRLTRNASRTGAVGLLVKHTAAPPAAQPAPSAKPEQATPAPAGSPREEPDGE
jgi:hypothetical protein